jgi:TrmH family RNA methyltransferase
MKKCISRRNRRNHRHLPFQKPYYRKLHSKENASIIIIESVEKPGNLGAILRSCEAFGIDALIVTDPKVDFYNPNVLRSSVGCFSGCKFLAVLMKKFWIFRAPSSTDLYDHDVEFCC